MRARNVILTLIGLFVLALTGTAFYLFTHPERVVEWLVEFAASEILETEVSIDGIALRWDEADGLSGVSVMGLSIDNPAGFSPQRALRIGLVDVEFGRAASPQGPISIRELRVVSSEIYYEQGETGSNLAWFEERLAGLSREDPAPSGADPEELRRLAIGTVSFQGGRMRAALRELGDRELQLSFPAFELRRLGGTEGAPPAEIATEIVSAFARRVHQLLEREVGPGPLRGSEWGAEAPLSGR